MAGGYNECCVPFRSRGVAVRMRNRDTYSPEDVEWADIIFAAGGQLLVIPLIVTHS